MIPHPRVWITQAAQIDLDVAVCNLVQKHDLTYAELTAIMLQCLAGWTKSAVREERKQGGNT